MNFQLPLGNFIWTSLSVVLSSPMLVMSFCSSYIRRYEAKHHYDLSNPINCQFWHHSWVQLEELPQNMVSHPYLIFSNKQDIKHFLFLQTFSYHLETLYETHCWQCEVSSPMLVMSFCSSYIWLNVIMTQRITQCHDDLSCIGLHHQMSLQGGSICISYVLISQ